MESVSANRLIILLLLSSVGLMNSASISKHNADVKTLASKYSELYPNSDPTEETECAELEDEGLSTGDEFTIEARNALADPDKRWPEGIVPYVINKTAFSYEQLKIIRAAMIQVEQNTMIMTKNCVRFISRTSQSDYVLINALDYLGRNNSCSSYTGKVGGNQTLSLGIGCLNKGIIMHELLHVLGFHHEHKRPDRDMYIKINEDNIIEGGKHQFVKMSLSDISLLDTPYDYGSIMHYRTNALANDTNIPVIVPFNPEVKIGQRDDMSPIDILRVRILYDCTA